MYTGDTDIDEMSLEDTSETTNLVGHRPEMDPSEAKHESGLSIGTKQPKTTLFIWVLAFFSAIGGFLFGYDTGVVSGAMLLVKNDFSLTSVGEEVVVSVTIGSAFVAALCGGVLNDRFGRKSTTILASLVFTIGGVILGAAQNLAMLVTGRLILGIGIGMMMMIIGIGIGIMIITIITIENKNIIVMSLNYFINISDADLKKYRSSVEQYLPYSTD